MHPKSWTIKEGAYFMKKERRKNKMYSYMFKIFVILSMREYHLGYRETVRTFWLTHSRAEEDCYTSTLKRWNRIFLEEGEQGLMKERKGRKRKDSLNNNKTEPINYVNEDIYAENERLRAENDYLKKLDALVREREEREKRRKPE